jgi:hypothetical protein
MTMRYDTPRRSPSARWLAAPVAALALAAAPLAVAAQRSPAGDRYVSSTPQSGYPQAAEDAGVYAPGPDYDAPSADASAADASSAPENADESYGYFRVVSGQATDTAASG